MPNANIITSGESVQSYQSGTPVYGDINKFDFGTGFTVVQDPVDPTKLDVSVTGGGGGGTSDTNDAAATCPTSVAVGNVVYVVSAGAVDKADNSSAATMPAVGFVSTKPTTTTCTVRSIGKITLSGLTAGATYHVGTAGAITATVPSSGLDQRVGIAISATDLLIKMDADFSTL